MSQKQTKKEKEALASKAESKTLFEQWRRSYDALNTVRDTWDEKEALLIGELLDQETVNSAKSRVFDPRLSTIIWERASRVTAQIHRGRIQVMSVKDRDPSLLMQTTFDKYIIPNANTDYSLDIKNKLLDFYSLAYGSFCVLTDWMVTPSYVGPDYRLLPIRDVVPQAGRTNIPSCDYVFVRSRISKEWLLDRDKESWKNIDKIVELTSPRHPDKEDQTFIEDKYDRYDFNGDSEDIELITKYMPDRWITFYPKRGSSAGGDKDEDVIIVRDIKNPHGNNRIPIVKKDCFPLMDRFHGLGEFERGKSLQYAINSLINLYLDGVKMSIFPPMKVYLPDVMAETLQNGPGLWWMLKSPNPRAIEPVDISPRGIDTFQSTYQFLNGAIQNAAGTSDTSISPEMDPGMGKTPQALKMQFARQNARDSWDRQMLDAAMEQIYDNFVDLMSRKQVKPIKMVLAKEDLESISEYRPDLVEMFESGKYGEVIIDPSEIKGNTFKFFIEKGSSMPPSDEAELATLKELLMMVMKIPNLLDMAMKTGFIEMGKTKIDVGEMFKRLFSKANISDWQRIVVVDESKGIRFNDPEIQQMYDAMMAQEQGAGMQGMGGMQDPMQQGTQNNMQGQQSGMLPIAPDQLYGGQPGATGQPGGQTI
jgi:hypothetical protein